jgi:hypothetical protein
LRAGLSGPEISVRRSWTVTGLVALGQSIGGGLYSESTTPRARFTLYSKLPGSFRPICVRRTRREQLADVRNRQPPTIKPRVPIPRAEVASCFGAKPGCQQCEGVNPAGILDKSCFVLWLYSMEYLIGSPVLTRVTRDHLLPTPTQPQHLHDVMTPSRSLWLSN